jgi:hypothetical protein
MQKVNRSAIAAERAAGANLRPSLREIELLRAMVASGKTTLATPVE